MKSVQEFLERKLVRAELGEQLRLETDAPPHATLGPHQGTLIGPGGALAFYAEGLLLSEGATLRYDALVSIAEVDVGDGRGVELRTDDQAYRLRTSPAGALVTFATLRWVGRALLRRPLDREAPPG